MRLFWLFVLVVFVVEFGINDKKMICAIFKIKIKKLNEKEYLVAKLKKIQMTCSKMCSHQLDYLYLYPHRLPACNSRLTECAYTLFKNAGK